MHTVEMQVCVASVFESPLGHQPFANEVLIRFLLDQDLSLSGLVGQPDAQRGVQRAFPLGRRLSQEPDDVAGVVRRFGEGVSVDRTPAARPRAAQLLFGLRRPRPLCATGARPERRRRVCGLAVEDRWVL